MPTVQADFGATRGAASLAFTLAMLGFGSGGVVMGKLSDRLGIVTAIAIGIVAMLFGYLGAGYSAALWQFNVMHFLIGLGAAATFGPLMTEASHWFDRHRGLAVTIAASGNYINRMSNYCGECTYSVTKKTGEGACPFNALYWDFMARHRKRFEANQRIGRIYGTWDKMGPEKQRAYRASAKAFLDTLQPAKNGWAR